MSEIGADPRPEICDGFCMDGCEVDELIWRVNRALRWAWSYRLDARRFEHWESISRRQRNEVMAHNDALRAALREIAATATQGAQITAPLAGRVLLQIERTARAALETR